jgi:glyoxylase-like metal-dependent hydrolase (beta-lactamase superfamily II)
VNVIHTGDIVFYCGFPFIDVNHGGTIDGVIAAVEAILGMCDEQTRIVPGHGPLTTAEGLRSYRDMLRAYRDVVAKEAAAGKDLEAIRSDGATDELDERWGKVFFPPEAFTEMVLRTLPE